MPVCRRRRRTTWSLLKSRISLRLAGVDIFVLFENEPKRSGTTGPGSTTATPTTTNELPEGHRNVLGRNNLKQSVQFKGFRVPGLLENCCSSSDQHWPALIETREARGDEAKSSKVARRQRSPSLHDSAFQHKATNLSKAILLLIRLKNLSILVAFSLHDRVQRFQTLGFGHYERKSLECCLATR